MNSVRLGGAVQGGLSPLAMLPQRGGRWTLAQQQPDGQVAAPKELFILTGRLGGGRRVGQGQQAGQRSRHVQAAAAAHPALEHWDEVDRC